MGSRFCGQAGEQLLKLVHAGVELGALLVDGAEHGVEVVDHLADELVARREILGEGAGGRQEAGQRAALALQQLHDCAADLVDLGSVEALEDWLQSAEEGIQVERGLRVLPRDGASRRDLAQFAWACGDLEIAVADEVLVTDGRARRGVELIALVDVEGHIDGVVRVQRHRADRSHRNAGNAHILSGLQPCRVGERRVVLGLRREPELTEHHHQHRRDQKHRDGEEADVEQGPVTLHQYSSLSAKAPLNRNCAVDGASNCNSVFGW